VLDEARNATYPCRRFISHRHCQHVLDLYLTGHYRGSHAAVPSGTSVFPLLLQSLIQLIQPFWFGYFPFEACAVACAARPRDGSVIC
jgi:hypothetical protein